MQNPSEKACDICGDIGIAEVLATCSKCHNSRQHIYCMHRNLCTLPVSWFCEQCLNHTRDPPHNVHDLCIKETVEGLGRGLLKVSDATETVGLPACQSIEGNACALSSGAEEKPVDSVVLSQENGGPNSDGSYKFGEENLPNPPAINALWRGSLKILGSDSDEIYDGFQAYPPAKVLREAYLVSKEMPQVLHFTLQPRADVWTGIFHTGSPSGLDIALYFWVDDLYRERYNFLLEQMEKQDLSLVSHLDNKELLIFTSRELPVESQKMDRKFYLWGVFSSLERRHSSVDLKGKQTVVDLQLLSCEIGNGSACLDNEVDDQMVDMEIDNNIVGGKKDWNADICLTSNSPAACRDTSDVPCQDAINKGNEEVANHLQNTKREKDDDYGVPPGSRPVVLKERPSVEMREKPHSTDVSAVHCRVYEDLANRNENVHVEDMRTEKASSNEVGGVDKCLTRTSLAACQVTSDVPSLDASNQGNEKIAKRLKAIKREKADDYGAPPGFSRPILSNKRHGSVEMQEKRHPVVDIGACEDSVDLDENIFHREDMVIEKVGNKKVGGDDYVAPGFSRPISSEERSHSVEIKEKEHPTDNQTVNSEACEDLVNLDDNILQVEDMGVKETGRKEVGRIGFDGATGLSKPILSKERCASIEMKEKQHPSDIKSVNCRGYENSVNLDENIHHIEDVGILEIGSKGVGGPDICFRSDSKAACWDNLDPSQEGFAKEKHSETEECGNAGAPPALPQPINMEEQQSSYDLMGKHVVDPPLPNSRIAEVSVTLNKEVDDPEVDMEIHMAGRKGCCGIVDIHLKRNVAECPDTMHILPDKVFPRVDSHQPIESTGQCDYFNAPPGFSKPAHVDGQSVVDMPLIIYTTGEEPMTVAEVVDDYVVDMEIDMVGGEEVGIIDVRDTVQGVIDAVHSDQLTNTVASQSHQTRRGQCDAGALGVSKLAINVPTEEPIAMQISSIGHNLDAPPAFSISIKMAKGTSSIKDHQSASNGGKGILGAHPAIGCLKDVKEQEDEDELTCMVCKKGYHSKPNDTLGVYSYSKQVKRDTTTNRCVYTTVSNFNIIHFQCHRKSKRAGNPKKEWQGALIRNHGALCNSIFPIKSPSVSTLQYVRCVSEYWGNLNKLGCAHGSRLQLLSYDLLLMLGKFSTRKWKSFQCGDLEKYTRFLPFMIQMGRYLAEQEGSAERQINSKAISSCLQSCSTQPNQLQLMMVNSLLLGSYETWLTHRPAFLECGIELAYMQHKNKQPLFPEPVAASEKFCTKPILVYVGLIEQLQRFFKLDTTSRKVSWEVIMTEKLNNIKELLGFSKKLLVWLEEIMLARKLSRVFEIMDVSSNVDFGKLLKYEDSVRDATPSIKKGRKRKRKEKKGVQVV